MRVRGAVRATGNPVRRAHLAAAVVLLVALTGCAPTLHAGGVGPGGGNGRGNGGGDAPPSRVTGNWILESASDVNGAMNLGGSTVTLKVNGRQSGGQGPCNAYGASVSGTTTGTYPGVYTGPIKIRVGIHTEMACARQTLNELETRYFAVLGTVTSASLVDHTLVLRGPHAELRFDKVR